MTAARSGASEKGQAERATALWLERIFCSVEGVGRFAQNGERQLWWSDGATSLLACDGSRRRRHGRVSPAKPCEKRAARDCGRSRAPRRQADRRGAR